MPVQLCDFTLRGWLSYYTSCTVASEVYCNNVLYKMVNRVSMSSVLIPFVTDVQQIIIAFSENVK